MSDEDQTEKVKIGETSVPEMLLRPLSLLPWCRNEKTWAQHHHYSHLMTPWLFALLCAILKRWTPIWIPLAVYVGMAVFHIGIKELILDRRKNVGNAAQRDIDLTTRIYGTLIGWSWLLS